MEKSGTGQILALLLYVDHLTRPQDITQFSSGFLSEASTHLRHAAPLPSRYLILTTCMPTCVVASAKVVYYQSVAPGIFLM